MQYRRFDIPRHTPARRLWILPAIALVIIFLLFRWMKADDPVDPADATRISVRIEQGMSAEVVADLLEEKGLIRSSMKFGWVASRSGQAGKLQAGSYVLQPSQSLQEILQELTGGQQGEVVVTIPEGFTVSDIDALLVKLNLAKEGDAQACANDCKFENFDFLPDGQNLAERGGRVEGYLYADTYFVDPQSFSVESFFERLLSTFEARVVDEYAEEIRKSGRPLHEIVTMASLIEEETRTDDERAIVSGILWKRFDEGMGLQVDATVRYIIHKPTATITASDLQTDSPYNTRKFRGLPPGPIANPSLGSLRAALNPESSPYYYYLHGTDGQIRYAETNDEHNINRAKYL